jgi:transcriptional regulator with XRE-family HTH domain
MSDSDDRFLVGFAHNLTCLMEAQGKSVAAVAAVAGLKPSRIERFLKAEVEPGAIEIMRLAKALDVTPGVLVDEIPRKPDGEV